LSTYLPYGKTRLPEELDTWGWHTKELRWWPFQYFLRRKPIGVKETICRDFRQKESETRRRKYKHRTISSSYIFEASNQQGYIFRNGIVASVIKFCGYYIFFAQVKRWNVVGWKNHPRLSMRKTF
jgi:hypothetical protein